MCQIPTRFPCLINIFLTHKHMKSIHTEESHSLKGQVNEFHIWIHSACIFLFTPLLYSIWTSECILRFPVFQAMSNFPNDSFSFLRDRQWNQKMSYMGKIMLGSYSEPSLHSSIFCGGMNFNDSFLLSHVYASVFPGMD